MTDIRFTRIGTFHLNWPGIEREDFATMLEADGERREARLLEREKRLTAIARDFAGQKQKAERREFLEGLLREVTADKEIEGLQGLRDKLRAKLRNYGSLDFPSDSDKEGLQAQEAETRQLLREMEPVEREFALQQSAERDDVVTLRAFRFASALKPLMTEEAWEEAVEALTRSRQPELAGQLDEVSHTLHALTVNQRRELQFLGQQLGYPLDAPVTGQTDEDRIRAEVLGDEGGGE